jgi:ATP-dependent RNA helicase DDX3X
MFSATFPRQIQSLAQDFMNDYVFLSVGIVGSSCALVTQKVLYVEEAEKQEVLQNVLPKCTGRTLIFVERKRSCEVLTDWLTRMGVDAVPIHGGRSQEERKRALNLFKSGECPILVATDVASRGLDIEGVTDVINYDMPNNIDSYVHRIGRTGRCGNTGTATTFVNERCKNVLQDLFHKLRENKQETPAWFVQLYQRAGTIRTSFSNSTKFGGNDVRKNHKPSLGMQKGGGGTSAAAADDGWSDDDAVVAAPKEVSAETTSAGDGWDSD